MKQSEENKEQWQLRWVVLQDDFLYYFENAPVLCLEMIALTL